MEGEGEEQHEGPERAVLELTLTSKMEWKERGEEQHEGAEGTVLMELPLTSKMEWKERARSSMRERRELC
jgi:hypothetical protein